MKPAYLFMLITLFYSAKTKSQNKTPVSPNNKTVSLKEQLSSFTDIPRLPEYFSGSIVAQTSTYDTTGGNNDGFSGTYSYIRKENDSSLVIFDVKGPGVINRIWTPTPSADTLVFYIDDTTKPAFSINYMDLFSGKVYPFVKPLCGSELGGWYSYLPIPFAKHCKIICKALNTKFHQIGYRLYPVNTPVKSFSVQLGADEREALKQVGELWNKNNHTVGDFYKDDHNIVTASRTISLRAGEHQTIFDDKQGGRILGIHFDNASMFEGLLKLVDIKITWDNEQTPAVYCPVADFFGYAFGNISMQSLLLGTRDNKNYSFLPMPFDKAAKIELFRRKSSTGDDKALQIASTISYTNRKRDSYIEGKLYTQWNSNKLSAGEPAHVFLNTKGKGHYIGSILQAQGMKPGMTYFFEGDDSTAIDNTFRIHGTGSEDYFNGGWYAFPDRWSRRMSLPLHGSLDYSLPFCRTGAYRFYLSDKISFEKNIYQSIEHGPENNNVPVDYTSLALYYADSPPATFLTPTDNLTAVYVPDTLTIYPQLMNFVIWDNVSVSTDWKYNTGGETFIFIVNDESRLKILLQEIPHGKYKLFADYTKNGNGCAFSFWQGQNRISEIIDGHKNGDEERIPQQYIGDITLNEFSNSLTIQFRTTNEANRFLLSRLIFVAVNK